MDDYQYADEPVHATERNAFERVGYGIDEDETGTVLISGTTRHDLQLKTELTVEEFFMIRLKEDLNQLSRNLYKRLDMSYLRKSIQNIPHLMYKNPLTYALGFYCVHDNQIDIDRISECEALCVKEKKPIKRSDILRYARLVISHIL